jgi:hypothetical protein
MTDELRLIFYSNINYNNTLIEIHNAKPKTKTMGKVQKTVYNILSSLNPQKK